MFGWFPPNRETLFGGDQPNKELSVRQRPTELKPLFFLSSLLG